MPAFRAVAETEHLQTAASALHLSPSALSRAVRLLEDDLGVPLFDRVGRGLRLNAQGEVMLGAVRDAMRGVHSALERIDGKGDHGTLLLAVDLGWLAALVMPALTLLRASHPQLQVELVPLPTGSTSAARALRSGRLDVVVQRAQPEADVDGLASETLLQTEEVRAGAALAREDLGRPRCDALRSVVERVEAARAGADVWLPEPVARHAGLASLPPEPGQLPRVVELVALRRPTLSGDERASALTGALVHAAEALRVGTGAAERGPQRSPL